MEQILANIYRLKSLIVNQYIIIDHGEIFLIDTSLKGSYRKLFREFVAIDLDYRKIRQILITHADSDHYGSACQIMAKTQASVCASKEESQAMTQGRSSRELKPKGLEKLFYSLVAPLFASEPVKTDIILTPGVILPILDGLEILDTRGHTPGHLSFYFRKSGVLFAGDSITMNHTHISPSFGANTWDENISQKAFDYQMSLHPRYICAGHTCIKVTKD